MQYCGKCQIHIEGKKRCCPLCQGELSGEPSGDPFPVLPNVKLAKKSLLKISSFLFVVLVIAMFCVGVLTDFKAGWAYWIVVFAFFAWFDIVMCVWFKLNVLKCITVQGYICIVMSLFVDHFTGWRGWSVQWTIPACYIGMLFLTVIIGRGLKLLLEEYVIFILTHLILAQHQWIYIVLKYNRFAWPAIICMFFMIFVGVTALFFRFQTLKNASAKTFHM